MAHTKKTKFHLLFEQSGTFKKVLGELGYKAKDYDIANDYGQTDVQCDLFEEIDKAYLGLRSIFDKIKQTDIVIAFFPCTQFESQKSMFFRGDVYHMGSYTNEQKLATNIFYHEKLHNFYIILTKMVIVCLRMGIQLIVENPRTQPHYLNLYWSMKPSVIDNNRRDHGDYYKKPTQYWFFNIEPKNNFVNMNFIPVEQRLVNDNHWATDKKIMQRSEIHPQYAKWFLKTYVLECDEFELT